MYFSSLELRYSIFGRRFVFVMNWIFSSNGFYIDYVNNACYSDWYPNGCGGSNLCHLVECSVFADAATSGESLAIF